MKVGDTLGEGRGIFGSLCFFWEKSSYWFQVVGKQEGPGCPQSLVGGLAFQALCVWGEVGFGLRTWVSFPFELEFLSEPLVWYFSDLEMEKYLLHSKCLNP